MAHVTTWREAVQVLLSRVNIDKTKVVVFRNGWRPVSDSFYNDNRKLEIVDSYVYLGTLLHYNGKFMKTQKRISQQGSKALYALLNSLRNIYIDVKQKLLLFDSMVGSILHYGSEVWGFHRAHDIEVVFNKFCRYILCLSKNAPISFMCGELGHLPMNIIRKHRIIKYWFKIINHRPAFVYDIYKVLYNDVLLGKHNWVLDVRELLYSLGLNDVWINQDFISDDYEVVKQRINDQYFQQWLAAINSCERLSSYVTFKTNFDLETYLSYNFNISLLTKLRSGTLALNIETGRYDNRQREQRFCSMCDMSVVESDYHFILVCPALRALRLSYLPKYFCMWPNTFKLKLLLKGDSLKNTRKLCQYLFHA